MRFSIFFPAAALLPQAFSQLNALSKAKGLTYFGSATDNGELTDTTYTGILSDNTEFGQITPGNSQKWDTTELTQGTFSFTKGDVITALAANNSQLVRCHTLVWYSQLPSWVSGGTWTNATLTAVMENHITKVMEHYKGQCTHWDVVNEAFNEDGTYRASVFYTTIGEAYIPLAFKAAAAADPSAKLYYNDYNIESSGAKSTAAQNLVKSLKAQGVQIDGVGMQAHFIVGSTPNLAAQTTNLEAFTALGVEVAYTELDIRHPSVPATAAQLATQATDYANTVNACLAVDSCVGITIWDFTDKYSWIPSVFSGAGEACLYNEDFTKKPAYDAVVNVLGGSASATKSAGSSSVVNVVATSAPATTLMASVKSVTSASSLSTPSSVVEVSSEVLVVSSTPTTSADAHQATSAAAEHIASSASSTKDSCKFKYKTSSAIATPTQAQNSTTATTGTGGATAQKYYQCGGSGWTGAKTCVEGTTCMAMNDWYSQCV